MALTRKFLTAMGIEEDKLEQIINAHTEVTSALKEERDSYKEKADKLPELQKELSELKEAASVNNEDAFKVKYEALKEEFKEFKDNVNAKETKSKKEHALKQLLKDIGISEKRIDSVIKVSDVEGMELDGEGKLKDVDKLTEALKEEWSDFITTQDTKGAETAKPPVGSGKAYKTKGEIMAIKDSRERRKAISENHELFGF